LPFRRWAGCITDTNHAPPEFWTGSTPLRQGSVCPDSRSSKGSELSPHDVDRTESLRRQFNQSGRRTHFKFNKSQQLARLPQDVLPCTRFPTTTVYTGAVPDAELRKITVDYTIEFARVLRASSAGAALSFLSGMGADQTGRSRAPFARYKGEAEKGLLGAGFPQLYIFRPAYIYPAEPRREPNFSYRLLRAIYPVFRMLFPNQVIPADDLARAMVDVAVRKTAERIKSTEHLKTATSDWQSKRWSRQPGTGLLTGSPHRTNGRDEKPRFWVASWRFRRTQVTAAARRSLCLETGRSARNFPRTDPADWKFWCEERFSALGRDSLMRSSPTASTNAGCQGRITRRIGDSFGDNSAGTGLPLQHTESRLNIWKNETYKLVAGDCNAPNALSLRFRLELTSTT
jgi:hypothetical protein